MKLFKLISTIFLITYPGVLCSLTAAGSEKHDADDDCCEWDHVPTDPSDLGLFDDYNPWVDSIDNFRPDNPNYNFYNPSGIGPFHAVDYLQWRPEMDVHERMLLSMEAFKASPNIGHRLLWLAAEAGHTSVAEALLRAGASPFGVNDRGKPSSRTLVVASRRGDVEIMRLLVEAGVDPDMSLDGWQDVRPDWWENPEPAAVQHTPCELHSCGWETTPIFLAAEHNHTAMVQWLLQTGRIDLTRRHHNSNKTVLETAAHIGHSPTFKLLMEHCVVNGDHEDHQPCFIVSNLLEEVAGTGDLDLTYFTLRHLGFPVENTHVDRRGMFHVLATRHRQLMMHTFRGILASSRASKSFIQHFLDYFRVLEKVEIPGMLEMRDELNHSLFLAVSGDRVDVFALLMELNAQYFNQLSQSGSGTDPWKQSKLWSMRLALEHDRPGIVKYLIEEEDMDPNINSRGYLPFDALRDRQHRSETLLELSSLKGSYNVARYLLENTNPYISGLLGHDAWDTPLSCLLRTARFDPPYQHQIESRELDEVVGLLLRRGGPVSLVSPEGSPKFENNSVIVDVVGDFGSSLQPRVCLCWGYRETMRPKPNLRDKGVVRLELKQEDETWWRSLQRMIEVSSNSEVQREEL